MPWQTHINKQRHAHINKQWKFKLKKKKDQRKEAASHLKLLVVKPNSEQSSLGTAQTKNKTKTKLGGFRSMGPWPGSIVPATWKALLSSVWATNWDLCPLKQINKCHKVLCGAFNYVSGSWPLRTYCWAQADKKVLGHIYIYRLSLVMKAS